MNMHNHSDSPSWPCDARGARERIGLWLELSLFRQALAEVHRYPSWRTDPESLRQLGWIMHRFASRSKDPGCTYSFARGLYRTAATYTRDPSFRAEVLACVGASYLEEGRLDDALNAFATSRSLAPRRYHAHLGLLAIACATQAPAAIRRRCEAFVEAIPSWHEDRDIVAALVVSSAFSFLRESPELFLACFGGYPDHLRALHERYCLEALEPALASFAPEESEDLPRAPELARVVRRTFDSIGSILRSRACTLGDISAASLQARIGF